MARVKQTDRNLGFWSAVSIGVGGMIGAGIFSILGPAVEISGPMVLVAFLIAGIVALINAYNYSRLSAAFPSAGGAVEFLIRGLGDNIATGGLNILLWAGYIIAMSLYVRAFAAYSAALFPALSGSQHAIMIGVMMFFTFLNFKGSKTVGRSELAIVSVKLALLLFFGVIGLFFIKPELLAPGENASSLNIVFASAFVFLAYEGFGLIANTAEDIRDPKKNLSRAFYTSILIVAAVYLLVSASVVGNLPPEEVKKASDYALAEAAKPFLGSIGFALMSLAALFSTSSAINATLYGGANVSYILAKYGELPRNFERRLWRRGTEGLVITSLLVLLLALFLDLSSIAVIGSASFLIIYAGVGTAHYISRKRTGGNGSVILASIIADVLLFAFLVAYLGISRPWVAVLVILVIFLSMVMEGVYRALSGRRMTPRKISL